jgi:hypothetical protein
MQDFFDCSKLKRKAWYSTLHCNTAAVFQKHEIFHVVSGKCLEMTPDGARLQMKPCDTNNLFQQWTFKTYHEEKARRYGLVPIMANSTVIA